MGKTRYGLQMPQVRGSSGMSARSSRKVLLIGYYGSNFGDLAMLRVLVKYLTKEGCKLRVLSYAADSNVAEREIPGTEIRWIKHGRWRGLGPTLRDLQWADDVVWGGGTCFMDQGGDGAIKYMLLAKLLWCRVFYLGIGVGTVSKPRTRRVLWVASLISEGILVRDERSRQLLTQKEARRLSVAPDLFYALTPWLDRLRGSIDVQPGQLLIAYRSVEEYFGTGMSQRHRAAFVERAVEFCAAHQVRRVVLLDTDAAADGRDGSWIFQQLRGRGYDVARVELRSTEETAKQIAAAEYVLTGRLHIGMAAAILRKKFALLNYSPKNAELMKQIGCEKGLVEYGDLATITSLPVVRAAPESFVGNSRTAVAALNHVLRS